MSIVGLDHVQVAAPPGCEADARRFYSGVLGLTELPKPHALAGRGGAWFALGSGQQLHVGVEDPFRPARKAHPAFVLADVAELQRVAERLTGLGFDVDWSQRDSFPGHQRLHTFDAHGNRVELLAAR